MPQATKILTMQAGGESLGRPRTRSGGSVLHYEVDLPAGDGGELTTRTSDTVGTATMDEASHSITTGMTVNIFWDGGVRYGVTVGTVSGTSVPFSLGSGDNLPIATTGLTITEVVTATVAIDGDQIQMIGIENQVDDDTETMDAHVQFLDSGSAEIAELDLSVNTPLIYDIAGGDTNPFTGNPIESISAANGSTSNAAKLRILSVENVT